MATLGLTCAPVIHLVNAPLIVNIVNGEEVNSEDLLTKSKAFFFYLN